MKYHVVYVGYVDNPLDYGVRPTAIRQERPCDGKLSIQTGLYGEWYPLEWVTENSVLWRAFPVAEFSTNG